MLDKLSILAFTDPKFEQAGPPVGFYRAMFNPEKFNVRHVFNYDSTEADGSTGSTNRFKNIEPHEYTFEFVIDGTGASGETREVFADLELFKYTVGYYGNIHRPHYLMLVWGTFIARCVMKEMTVNYELFRSNGIPLRATIHAKFRQQSESLLEALINKISSPDLTHVRVAVDGDNLPLMTQRIYKSTDYYLDVARANNLNTVRKIDAGDKVNFPPLEKEDK